MSGRAVAVLPTGGGLVAKRTRGAWMGVVADPLTQTATGSGGAGQLGQAFARIGAGILGVGAAACILAYRSAVARLGILGKQIAGAWAALATGVVRDGIAARGWHRGIARVGWGIAHERGRTNPKRPGRASGRNTRTIRAVPAQREAVR